jgi:hypothetical protein
VTGTPKFNQTGAFSALYNDLKNQLPELMKKAVNAHLISILITKFIKEQKNQKKQLLNNLFEKDSPLEAREYIKSQLKVAALVRCGKLKIIKAAIKLLLNYYIREKSVVATTSARRPLSALANNALAKNPKI